VWNDVARWWHAGLHNLCGPWSRAYGMDMRTYAALLGLWIGSVDRDAFPDVGRPFDHSHDTTFAPMIDLVGNGMTAAVGRALTESPEPHLVEQRITAERVATGWVGANAMFGGEAGSPFPARGQYHPATAHWRGGWLRVRHDGAVDAVASEGRLVVAARTSGTATLIVHGDPARAVAVEADGRPVDLPAGGKIKLADAKEIVVNAVG